MGWYGYGFRPYVSVAQRRANAGREVAKLAKKGRTIMPVKIGGRQIAQTFWGKAWCDHMENYSDYANRLPRGRTYVRNGSVVDLQIEAGRVTALVAGSELYEIDIKIERCSAGHWKGIRARCAGQIGSLIELLQGKLSAGIMAIISGAGSGLFPTPKEIKLECSCPDGAYMCKHLAAVLYGVGARLDQQPELLFTLRQVDHLELIARAGDVEELVKSAAGAGQKTLGVNELAEVFGIELEPGKAGRPVARKPVAGARAGTRKGAERKRGAARTGAPKGAKRGAARAGTAQAAAVVDSPPARKGKAPVKGARRRRGTMA